MSLSNERRVLYLSHAREELYALVRAAAPPGMTVVTLDTPDEAERRIVNSTMLATEGDEISAEKQEEFVTTDKISQKNY